MSVRTRYQLAGRTAIDIAATVETAIRHQSLGPGEQLPPVRALAEELSVSPATVASAYRHLRTRGILVGDGRRGTRVAARPPLLARPPAAPPKGARDLASGNPDPALLPPLRAALGRVAAEHHLYGAGAHEPRLVELARSHFEADRVPHDHLCVVSGALDGIERVLAAHLRPGDRVAVENPGYAALFDLLRAQGLSLLGVGVDASGMRPAELELALARGARAVVITPRGQNPTGAALDDARAGVLRALLARRPEG